MNRERIVIFTLFLAVVAAVMGSIVLPGDSQWVVPTALSMVREGNTDLNEYYEEFAFTVTAARLYRDNPKGVERLLSTRPELKDAVEASLRSERVRVIPVEVNGRYYNLFPIGTALVSLPIVGILHLVGFDVMGRRLLVEHLVCALVVAAVVLTIYRTARLRIGIVPSLLVAVTIAYGTSLWSSAGTALLQHGPAALMLALGLYCLMRGEHERVAFTFAGLSLAFACVVRPTAGVAAAVLGFWVLLRHRASFGRFLLGAAAVAAPFLVYNLTAFGEPLPSYYTQVGRLFSKGFAHHASGVAGVLVSPARGLLVYSPVLVFAGAGMVVAIRRRESLAPFLAALLALYWLLISATDDWWGGLCYGPRYFIDVLPFLAFFLVLLFEARPIRTWGRVARAAFAVLLLFSVATHFTGAYAAAAKDWVRPEYRPCPASGDNVMRKCSYRVVVWDPLNFPWRRMQRAVDAWRPVPAAAPEIDPRRPRPFDPPQGRPAPEPPTGPVPLDRARYPWGPIDATDSIAMRFAPPPGHHRAATPPGSFAAWLRGLPLRPGRPPVLLHSGLPKSNQGAHRAVLDIDTGRRDLQQCADAVIRLRAEYLWQAGRRDAIMFHFTSGDPARWVDWRAGRRPRVRGNRVTWHSAAAPDTGRKNFRRYLDTVFTYAGTRSLAREMVSVRDPSRAQAGDVFIQGGSPGHAVLVVDTAKNDRGGRVLLLAQSYMPAQDIHVLRNPGDAALSPWYAAKRSGELNTPDWRFRLQDLRRFRE